MICECICGCRHHYIIDYSIKNEPICFRCMAGTHKGMKLEDEDE